MRVLELAQALKFLQVGQITVAVDGTKGDGQRQIHSAASYEHAGKTIEQLDLEVKELLVKAEQADSLASASTCSQHSRRDHPPSGAQSRAAKSAGRDRSPRAGAPRRGAAEHEKKLAEQAAKKERGEGIRGASAPKCLTPEPSPDNHQYNFTDPESRIMKTGSGQHFEQDYNAQAAR